MQLRAKVKLDLRNHLRVKRSIERGDGPAQDVLSSWEQLYRAFLLKRFDKFSLGGGNWRRLKPATRQRKKKNKNKILVASRFMRLKLESGIKVLRQTKNSIVVGFKMGMLHPDAEGLTVGELAEIHDQGLGVVPQRRIIVLPDYDTKREMQKSAKQIFVDGMNGK